MEMPVYIPTQTLTDDKDVQNDTIYGQMQTLSRQILLLDDHCTIDDNTEDGAATTSSVLCEVVSELHHFTQQIVGHVKKTFISKLKRWLIEKIF